MQMQTLYLLWRNMETLWCAKDPIDPDKRWVVYKTDGLYRFKGVWIKNLTETFVSEENILEKCLWKCLNRSMEHLVNATFNEDNLLSVESKVLLTHLNKIYGIPTSRPMDNSLQL